MLKKSIFTALFLCGFSFGFCQEDAKEASAFDKESVLNEIEKLKENKDSLNKVYSELSQEQQTALEEEFREQLSELQEQLDTLAKELAQAENVENPQANTAQNEN